MNRESLFMRARNLSLICAAFLAGVVPICVLADGQASSSTEDCKLNDLPKMVRQVLAAEFKDWMFQRVSNLTGSGRRGWEYKKYWRPNQCPGVAVGNFDGSRRRSYAVLLVPADRSDRAYELVLFSDQAGGWYSQSVLQRSNVPGAKDTFIRSVHINDFLDTDSTDRFKPVAPDAILLVESGTNQYGAEIYFRTQSGFRREPVEY